MTFALVPILLVNTLILYGLYIFFKNQFATSPLNVYIPIFILVKIIAGVIYGLVYTFYYQKGDTFSIFQDSIQFSNLIFIDKERWFNALIFNDYDQLAFLTKQGIFETKFLIKFLSIFNLLTNNNYWLSGAYLSFFNAICSWLLINKLMQIDLKYKVPALFALFFWPDLLFWSSGLNKEALAMGLFFLSIYFALNTKNKITANIIGYLFALFFLVQLKFYIAFASILIFFGILLDRFPFHKNYKFGLFLLGILLGFLIANTYLSVFYNENILSFISINQNLFKSNSTGKVLFFKESNDVFNIPINIILAFIYATTAPLIWQCSSLFEVISSLTALLTTILLCATVFNMLKSKTIHHHSFFELSIIFSSIILMIVVPISAPILGSLMRYRIAFTPILIFLCLTYFNRLKELK
ncbi:MAG: hypothetical protein SFY32_01710 [Bacteroidota bacterium]|nr:hypothetical protein [Bacteroidota bacterium]